MSNGLEDIEITVGNCSNCGPNPSHSRITSKLCPRYQDKTPLSHNISNIQVSGDITPVAKNKRPYDKNKVNFSKKPRTGT